MRYITGIGAVLVAISSTYLVLTLLLSTRRRRIWHHAVEPSLFVFIIPALNEAKVLEHTLDALMELPAGRTFTIVVDDASTDNTSDLASLYPDDRVAVVRRELPYAQQGKGAALNAAFTVVSATARRRGIDPRSVIVGIIDADGRLEPDALKHVAYYFRDKRVGAVQLQVRIRNRHTLLGRFQDYEFLLFSSITQTAREHFGSVGLGGNGQFARLAALQELGPEPWTDCLTEDLDLGIRLAINGWHNRFCRTTAVDQQGVATIARLVRQRTRWMQGHFQCWRLIPRVIASDLPTVTVLDLCYYLLAPTFALFGSLAFTLPIGIMLVGAIVNSHFYFNTADGRLYLVLLYLLSFGPVIFLALLYRKRARDIGVLATIGFAHLLALYSWVWYVAEWRAIWLTLTRRNRWTKTQRTVERGLPPAVARPRRSA